MDTERRDISGIGQLPNPAATALGRRLAGSLGSLGSSLHFPLLTTLPSDLVGKAP